MFVEGGMGYVCRSIFREVAAADPRASRRWHFGFRLYIVSILTYTTCVLYKLETLLILSPLNSLHLRFIGTLQVDTALVLASHVVDATIWTWTQPVTFLEHSP